MKDGTDKDVVEVCSLWGFRDFVKMAAEQRDLSKKDKNRREGGERTGSPEHQKPCSTEWSCYIIQTRWTQIWTMFQLLEQKGSERSELEHIKAGLWCKSAFFVLPSQVLIWQSPCRTAGRDTVCGCKNISHWSFNSCSHDLPDVSCYLQHPNSACHATFGSIVWSWQQTFSRFG